MKRYKATIVFEGVSGSSPAEAAGFVHEAIIQWETAKLPNVIITDEKGDETSHSLTLDD